MRACLTRWDKCLTARDSMCRMPFRARTPAGSHVGHARSDWQCWPGICTGIASALRSTLRIVNGGTTPIVAANGIATRRPMKPNNHPKAKSANISQAGLSLTRLPMMRGDNTWSARVHRPGKSHPQLSAARRQAGAGPRRCTKRRQGRPRPEVGYEAGQAGRDADQQPGTRGHHAPSGYLGRSRAQCQTLDPGCLRRRDDCGSLAGSLISTPCKCLS
jgi:hypothetical protein